MSQYHLAQLNIATAIASMESEVMSEFVENLERINQLGEDSPGFVWRLKDETGDATSIQVYDNPNVIVNLTVWQDPDSLKHFIFKTDHANFLKRKKQWFESSREATYVLWWIPAGHLPDLAEAKGKLEHLRDHGETTHAFSFKRLFSSPLQS